MLEGMGRVVRLFRENEPQSLADGLDRFLSDPEALARARHEAWRLGQSPNNWDLEKEALLQAVGERASNRKRELTN